MKYTQQEVMQYVAEEDVKFIRMAFCDAYGKQKNVAIMSGELERAFTHGIAIDASAVCGFGGAVHSDLFLRPDPSTLSVLPWRPDHGKVVRMFCSVMTPSGKPFESDTREILARAAADAEKKGISFSIGSEFEFYLFKRDENGNPTKEPYDNASYMDIAPEDKGENVRREICLTLEQMGIAPESSHHEEGPGQNEIDFRYSSPSEAADNAVTFRAVVDTVAARCGLKADFSPKPIESAPGNGMHINVSAKSKSGKDIMPQILAGILSHIREMTVFLNTREDSYKRFGSDKAPKFISWSAENRSQLIRIPAAEGEYKRAELRSPDPLCNPYLAYALIIRAGLDGIDKNLTLPPPADINLFDAPPSLTEKYDCLPESLEEAKLAAAKSDFIASVLPESVIINYTK